MRLLPVELYRAVEAENEREKERWFRDAWFASLLLRPHLRKGRALDPMDLMPKLLTPRAPGPRTKAEGLAELKAIRKRLNIE